MGSGVASWTKVGDWHVSSQHPGKPPERSSGERFEKFGEQRDSADNEDRHCERGQRVQVTAKTVPLISSCKQQLGAFVAHAVILATVTASPTTCGRMRVPCQARIRSCRSRP
jgi:hypothetical protein